ncbi:MAG: FAD-binding oxidoreductase, partial [Patescibacteria group bacterium]
SLTARSAGTDMTGGPLNESIILDFTKHFSQIGEVCGEEITAEPGVYYRDFEKKTLEKGMMMPSYPASREICAIGGMVANNSGGEKTLYYGKTENYVEKIKVVLSDGNEYEFEKLDKLELDKKIKEQNFEGEIYKKTFELLNQNYELIKKSKPKVSKNSTGYNIWHVWDKEKGEFDLSKLFVGSQGTLGIMTEATFRLVKAKSHSGLLVVFLKSLEHLPEIVKTLLPLRPISLESFDDNTFKLAAKFFWGFAKQVGAKNFLSLAFKFLPEILAMLTGGVPKLLVLAEFEANNQYEVDKQIAAAREKLLPFGLKTLSANTEEKAKKYWIMRRESFNLLRHRVKNRKTAPFIDDLIVRPEYLPDFLPKLYGILERFKFLYTIAGHMGDGNFHVIPLMRLEREEERAKIAPAMDEVYKLVFQYGGSISAEHNDGLIRSPYLRQMYGEEIYRIFEEIKKIFDPQNIFNPGKKVGADLSYALSHIKKE